MRFGVKHVSKYVALFLLIGCLCPYVCANETAPTEDNTGEDFLRPLSRFDIRYTYQEKTGDTETSFTTFRVDTPFLLDNGWTLATRFDMPIVHSDSISSDNPSGDDEIGSGDVLSQFLLISPHQGNWKYGFGMRLLWPTASQDQMGSGKYQMAPGFGINYYPDRWSDGSFLGIRFQEFFDYAGDDNRSDIHQTSIKPGFSYNLQNNWFVSSFPDIRINWEQDNDWFVPLNLKVGRKIDKRVVSIEFNTPIINGYDRYDWQVEFQFGFFF